MNKIKKLTQKFQLTKLQTILDVTKSTKNDLIPKQHTLAL